MSVDDAIEQGAMALFGEKYGDEVRVVSMGESVRGPKKGKTYSLELCGGTHVRNTGEIGLIKVVGEGAVAAGVRRVDALTGGEAFAYLEDQEERMAEIAETLKVSPNDAVSRVRSLVEERRKLERELAEARKKLALGGGNAGGEQSETVNGVSFLGKVVQGLSGKELKGLVDEAKAKLGSGVVMMVGVSEDGKASLVVGVTDDLTDRFNAVDLVKMGAESVGGKGGGGRPDMAQAGGPYGGKANDAVAAIKGQLSA